MSLLLAVVTFAQTQQGHVKSLGRPDKKGQPLSGVTIRAKGSHSNVVSDANGNFSLAMTGLKNGDAYTLQRVQKNGYEPNEVDLVGRRLAFSDRVPLTIVMASSEQLETDKSRIEDKAYEVAQRNYASKINTLEQQLGEKAITTEQYRLAIEDLQDKFENYQSLIDGMAKHYAHTDYDLLDDKEREINLCIEDGDLERADSLIRLLFDPIGVLQRNMEALADLEQQIEQAQSMLTQATDDLAAVLRQQKKDGEYLYQLFTIAAARFDNDKALQYIVTRAELDTINWEWQIDAATFCFKQNLIDQAEKYYNRGLDLLDDILINADLEHSSAEDIAQLGALLSFSFGVENNLAVIYHNTNRLAESEELFLSSIDYYKGLFENIPDPEIKTSVFGLMMGTSMMALSNLYRETGRLDESIALAEEAVEIFMNLNKDELGDAEGDVAKALMTQGLNYRKKGKYEESEKCYKEALEIHRRIAQSNPDNEAEVARTLHNYANLCNDLKRYEESEAMFLESLEIYQRLAKANPQAYEIKVASLKGDIALLYENYDRIEESEQLYLEAIEIQRKYAQIYPELFEPELALSLGNLGAMCMAHPEGRSAEGEAVLMEAYEIYQRLAEKAPELYDSKLAIVKYDLAWIYYKTDRIKESLPYWPVVLEDFRALSQENPREYEGFYEGVLDFVKELAPWVNGEAHDFQVEGKYEDAEIYFKSAADMFRWLSQIDPETYERELGTSLNDLAIVYNNTKRYEESEETYKQTLTIKRRVAKNGMAKDEVSLATTLNNLAYLYMNTKRYEESEALYLEALEIIRRVGPEDLMDRGHFWAIAAINLGQVYKDTQRYQESERLYEEAVTTYRKMAKTDPATYRSKIASTLNTLAIVYFSDHRYTESEASFKESLEIYLDLVDANPSLQSMVDQARNNLSALAYNLRKNANENKGKQSKAQLEQAMEIYQFLIPSNPEKYEPLYTATHEDLKNL